jgi:hypothetical protein
MNNSKYSAETNDCKPICPCKAANAQEAVARAANLIGVDASSAQSLVNLLAFHGWELRKS